MMGSSTVHIVDGCVRSRAQQAKTIYGLGHHCEVYASICELLNAAPRRGVIFTRDDDPLSSVRRVLDNLARENIWLPVVGTSVTTSVDAVVEAIKTGAIDYLSLPLQPARIASTLERICEEATAYAEARRRVAEANNRIAALTTREREVLGQLAEGRSNKSIARELDISPRTVEIHRANMMAKLGAQHAVEAVRLHLEAELSEHPVLRIA